MNPFEKADWIWRSAEAGVDEYCEFVSEFTADEDTVELWIAADSNYAAYCNGELCAFGQYADYPDYKVCDRVPLRVSRGKNLFCVTVWYYGIDSQTYLRGKAGVIFELRDGKGNVLAFSGSETLCRLSRTALSGRGALITPQLGPGFCADLTRADAYPAAVAEGFSPGRIVSGISRDFHLRPNQKTKLCDRLPSTLVQCGGFRYLSPCGDPARDMQSAALSFRRPSEMGGATGEDGALSLGIPGGDDFSSGVYLISDLGAETAGFLDLDVTVEEDCTLDVGYGEHLDDGRCRTDIRGFFCEIRLKKGRNRYLQVFRRFGCRYLQFFFGTRRVTVHYAGLRPVVYPLRMKEFDCGDLLRNTIYDVARTTLLHCLHEHYEDCPWREQALYTMDSRNQMLCGYYAFGEYEAPRAALALIAHGVRQDGLLSLCYPAGRDYPIPAFTCMYFVEMEEYLRYSGDLSLAREHLSLLLDLTRPFFDRMMEDGVVWAFADGKGTYWNFYEWVPTMDGANRDAAGPEAPLSAFFSLALQSLAGICTALGEAALAHRYRRAAEDLNRAIRKVFFRPDTGLFETAPARCPGQYSTLTQALCLLCGAAEDVDRSAILRILETNGKDAGGLCVYPNTISMNGFRFDALLSEDRARYAPVILTEIDRVYFDMLRHGATTFWETEKGAGDFDGAGSLCHGWSALPIYYYETLLNKRANL